MGNFVTRGRHVARSCSRAAYAFIGHLRGGLAMATIRRLAGRRDLRLSIATAATFAKVAYRR